MKGCGSAEGGVLALMQIRSYQPGDEAAVIRLWQECGLTRPWNDPRRDIARKLGEQPELFLIGTVDDAPMASAMAGYDGHRGWVYYLAVDESARGRGLGRLMMAACEAWLAARGIPKLNIMVRGDNAAARGFYESLGYALDDVVVLSRRLPAG